MIDQHGKTLSAAGDGAPGGRAAEDAATAIEDGRAQPGSRTWSRASSGAGKARVQVSADVDMAQVTTQEEKYDPTARWSAPSRPTSPAPTTTNGGASGAHVGLDPQHAGRRQLAARPSASGSDNTGTESTTNYEISKTITTQVQQPGTVKRLSVAVAVDGVTTRAGKDGKPGPTRRARPRRCSTSPTW